MSNNQRKMLKQTVVRILIISFFTLSVGFAQTVIGGNIIGEANFDHSGNSVSLSSDGSRVAIGALENDFDKGHVRVYEYSDSDGTWKWTKLGSDINGVSSKDEFGTSVSLSSDGSRVAIGAPKNNNGKGQVRVYEYSDETWARIGGNINGNSAFDYSGISVSLSSDGSRVAIGARLDDYDTEYNSGSVAIYEYSDETWTQLGSKIDGEALNDESGTSVSLSPDGSRVAIGAPKNGANDKGHVRVYAYNGSAWAQLGSDINGAANLDESGTSVSLSSDGSRVAIGSPLFGLDKGHTRIYEYNGSEPGHG